LTIVPFELRRSCTRIRAPTRSIWAWKREICGVSSRMSLLGSRPMVSMLRSPNLIGTIAGWRAASGAEYRSVTIVPGSRLPKRINSPCCSVCGPASGRPSNKIGLLAWGSCVTM